MIYDFMGKIKNAKNVTMLNPDTLNSSVTHINEKYKPLTEIKLILPQDNSKHEVIAKAKASVQSFPNVNLDDLRSKVLLFKSYLEEIAAFVNGEVNKGEGFYNNDRTFNTLY
jgi:hypothetical protein